MHRAFSLEQASNQSAPLDLWGALIAVTFYMAAEPKFPALGHKSPTLENLAEFDPDAALAEVRAREAMEVLRHRGQPSQPAPAAEALHGAQTTEVPSAQWLEATSEVNVDSVLPTELPGPVGPAPGDQDIEAAFLWFAQEAQGGDLLDSLDLPASARLRDQLESMRHTITELLEAVEVQRVPSREHSDARRK